MLHEPYGPYEKYIKRPLDLVCALVALALLSPLIGLTAVLVRVKLGSPVIFTQERPGKIDPLTSKEKLFKLYKFRTMTDEKDEQGNLLPDELRLTDFGKALRATSLDELPELINIIKGDMAIIGPRPLLVRYLPLYSEEQRHRHDVRPGLSGNAQVSGRNAITWQEKFKLDVEYVNSITFMGDLKIVLKTIITVFKKEGINSETNATMEDFRGNDI